MLDSIIIGGSSAGLSAALTLGRSLRRIIVLDSGEPCNRFSHASHGFLTQDGTSPSDLLRIAREQLAAYETVTFQTAKATSVTPITDGFEVKTADGGVFQARKLLLATGVRDELPALAGITAFWGKSVFHCPYCDGYEVRNQRWVVYGTSEVVLHQAMMFSQWTAQLTVCTDGVVEISAHQRDVFAREGISIVETPVLGVRGVGHQIEAVMLADGREIACQAMFVRPIAHHPTPFASDLGCDLDEMGLIKLDSFGRTTVSGVYAAGDISNPRRSVALSVAQGVSAGHVINADLMMERFA